MNATLRVTGKPLSIERILLLSDQEFRIFELLGAGYKSSEIAEAKGHKLSIKTVETYLMNIRDKLEIENVYQVRTFASKYAQLCETTNLKRRPRAVAVTEYAKFEFETVA